MRRSVSPRFLLYTLFLVAILGLFPLYVHYKQMAAPVPPGVYLGGYDASALKDPAVIQAQMEPVYNTPIGVRFEDQVLVLHPEDVGFTPDYAATIADAGRYLEGFAFVDIAVREAIGLPQQRRDIALRYHYDHAKLRAWLEKAAKEHDYPPLPPLVRVPASLLAVTQSSGLSATQSVTAAAALDVTETVTLSAPTATPAPIRNLEWIPGTPGHHVDVEASIPNILAALASRESRMADLALTALPSPPPAMADLGDQLPTVLDTFPVFGAIYVKDISTGEETGADGDVAFSGMTTLKWALAAALMDALPNGVGSDADGRQVGQWLDRAIGQSDDAAADQALAWLGGGTLSAGAQRVTAFMRRLGLENSYMQTGFVPVDPLPLAPTTANQREKPNTRADANLQTTPQEIGRLVSAIYECTEDRGLLRKTFPDTITPDECRAILFYFTHNELRDALWRGLPEYDKQWIVHQQGFSYTQHGDVALVWGPTGPYVISVYYFNPGLTYSENANRSVVDLSRIVWEFFVFRKAQGAKPVGEPPVLAPPPGYTEIDKYAPSAANPKGQ
jgi:beta-lactamase class A